MFYAHITKPEHIVRHRWHPGDVAMWDNRATVFAEFQMTAITRRAPLRTASGAVA